MGTRLRTLALCLSDVSCVFHPSISHPCQSVLSEGTVHELFSIKSLSGAILAVFQGGKGLILMPSSQPKQHSAVQWRHGKIIQ